MAFMESMALSFVFIVTSFAQERDRVPMTEHGAASMDYQLTEYDKLIPQDNVTAAPAGLDPVVWEAFIPQDNEMTPERVALGGSSTSTSASRRTAPSPARPATT